MKGIVFTFYDSGYWSFFNTAYPIFQKSFPGWKATYYADVWDSLTTSEKNQMLAAQAAGIEIANHQLTGVVAPTYLASNSEEDFWLNEVKAQQDLMIADGITPPTSFAYSAGEAPRTLSNLIISKNSAIKLVNHKTGGIFTNPASAKGYYKSIFPQGSGGIGRFDINSDSERGTFDLDFIISQLEYCKNNNDVYIHSGHRVSLAISPPLTNLYSTIAKLSKYCVCNGLSFYTMNDLVQAGFSTHTEYSLPTVSIITITGTQSVGNTLTMTYTYQDFDDTPQGTTTFQWYRADNAQGLNAAAIAGATSQNYTLVGADSGKFVRVGIVPKTNAAVAGVETFSKWFSIT